MLKCKICQYIEKANHDKCTSLVFDCGVRLCQTGSLTFILIRIWKFIRPIFCKEVVFSLGYIIAFFGTKYIHSIKEPLLTVVVILVDGALALILALHCVNWLVALIRLIRYKHQLTPDNVLEEIQHPINRYSLTKTSDFLKTISDPITRLLYKYIAHADGWENAMKSGRIVKIARKL